MANIKWCDNHIETIVPKKCKKISGTYFPTVLGFDPWKTPFEAWCKSTRTYEIPFEGNKYTNAGQIIEPKVFDFLRTSMGYGDRVKTPEDIYRKDYFKKTYGDFFPKDDVFSGMWDALIYDENGNIEYVVEIKTVQTDGRSGSLEDRWKNGTAPHYQALQASLYAYLLGVKKVLMVAVTLEDSKGDYEHPEQVIPSFANENVYTDEFEVLDRYPNFDMYIEKCREWWVQNVLTGISPEFDEKKDAEILKALRTNTLNPDTDIADLINEAEQLKTDIEKVTSAIKDKEKRLENIQKQIKEYAMSQFRDGDTKVSVKGKTMEYTLSATNSTEIDKKMLESDGLLEKYLKPKVTYRLTVNKIEEEK